MLFALLVLRWSKRETPRIKADFGISDWLPVVAMWIPRSQLASGDESERPAVWMWVSTQSMTKWGNKAPLGKETSTQMEKRHNRLGGNASLQNIMSRVSVGIL